MDLTVCRRAVAGRRRRLSPRSGSCCLRPSPRSFLRCRRLRLKSVLEVDDGGGGGGDGNTTNDTAARTSSAFYSISGNRNHRRRRTRTFPNGTDGEILAKGPLPLQS